MLRLAGILILAVLVSSPALAAEEEFTLDGPAPPLGAGYRRVAEQSAGDCLVAKPPEGVLPDEGVGDKVTYTMRRLDRVEELSESLALSAGAKFQAAKGGGGAKARYYREKAMNAFSVFFVVNIRVDKGIRHFRYPAFTDELKETIAKKDERQFRALCGDRYVRGYILGAEYVAIVELKSRSDEEKRELSAQIGGNYLAASFSAEMEKKFRSLAKTTQVEAWGIRSGGLGTPVPLTLEQVIEDARTFPGAVKEQVAALVYQIRLSGYETVPGSPQSTTPELQRQQRVVARMAQYYDRFIAVRGDYDYLLANPDQWVIDEVKLKEVRVENAKVAEVLDRLVNAYEDCVSSLDGCTEAKLVEFGALSFPPLPPRRGVTSQALTCKVPNQDFQTSERGCTFVLGKTTWSRTSSNHLDQNAATSYCDILIEGGSSNWRLPTKDELAQAAQRGADRQLVLGPNELVWTASDAPNSTSGVAVNASSGTARNIPSGTTLPVLCVTM